MSPFINLFARQPSPSVEPDYDNPGNRPTVAITLIAIANAFLLFFVVSRVYSRLEKGLFSWGEATCVLATAGSIAFSAVTIDACCRAVRKHQWDIRATNAISDDRLLQEILFFESAYGGIIFMAKLSLFMLYRRIFHPNRTIRGFIYFGIVTTGIFYLFCVIFPIIVCSPRNGETRIMSQSSARCAQEKVLGYIIPVFNIISDHYLLFLPISVVWKLQMPTRKKVEVCAVFLTGTLGCVCGVVNAYYRVILEKTDDGMRHMLPVLVTSIVEINIAIIVGCMPAFKHFVQTHIVAKKSSLHFFFSFSSYLRSRLSTTTRRSRNTPSGDFRKFSGHVDSKSNLKESENDNDNDNGNSISNLNDRLGEERRGGGGGGRRGEGKGEGEIVSFEMHAASPV